MNMNREIIHRHFFKQSPTEVWEYLTQPELLEQWLMKTDFQLRIGHKFSFPNKSGKVTYCEVLEILPNKLLSYSWKVRDANDETSVDSKVIWTLTEKDGGTELQLKHSGFMQLDDFTAHSIGWNNCLILFEKLLKTN
jgi:uncharacterized protein YndB with AHSA1/START domain